MNAIIHCVGRLNANSVVGATAATKTLIANNFGTAKAKGVDGRTMMYGVLWWCAGHRRTNYISCQEGVWLLSCNEDLEFSYKSWRCKN